MTNLVEEQKALDASVRAGNIEAVLTTTNYRLSPSKSSYTINSSAAATLSPAREAEIQRKRDEIDNLQREFEQRK